MTVALTYLLAILGFAVHWGLVEAVVSALASAVFLDYFFEDPLYHLTLDDPEKVLALAIFLAGSTGASALAVRIRHRTEEALRKQEELSAANTELEKRQSRIESEKRNSERLLLNILPNEVASELQSKGAVTPRYYEDATVLFTDFCSFSVSTEKLPAEDLVNLLHDYFTEFDRIVGRYGLEKLKTIGDSYMCLGGVPRRNPANPVDAVMAAFEILEAVVQREKTLTQAGWRVRIGLHTGPLIAGVVGIDKFAFDVWGDTVNYSSRMESSGAPDHINISERTYTRIKDFFDCEYRGKVMTKDKREIDMYFVRGVRPSLLAAPGAIPPEFARRYQAYFDRQPPAFPASLLSPVLEAPRSR
jgi:class 3 adenylate cyclase